MSFSLFHSRIWAAILARVPQVFLHLCKQKGNISTCFSQWQFLPGLVKGVLTAPPLHPAGGGIFEAEGFHAGVL
jgi:hypothetical protein